MREKLYKIDIHYDYIVFSQKWNGYDKNILNFDDYSKVNSLKRWEDFIQPTIKYFERISNNIIIIGAHPEVDGVSSLTPNIFLNKMHYREKLKGLKVSNVSYLLSSTGFFSQWKKNNLFVLNPMDIWGKDKFILYNEEWSFFRDSQHASNASNEYLEEKIRFLLSKKY